MGSKPVLLVSGGLDSYIYWELLGRPEALYVMMGHKYMGYEMETVAKLISPIQFAQVPSYLIVEQHDGHIPYRNLLLSLMAFMMEYDTVYIGALAGETSRDKSARFFRKTSRLLSFLEYPVSVKAPFRNLTKTELVRKYMARFAGTWETNRECADKLRSTRSCYNPSEHGSQRVACGQCQACFRRWVAMENNGIREEYMHNPADFGRAQARTHWQTYLLRAPLVEWPAIFRNNWQARRALTNAH